MLRLSFLIIFSILSFTFATYGQRCGGGTYWLNFVQKEPIKFELYSVTPKGMTWYSQEAKDWVVKNLSFFYEERLSLERSVLLDKNKNKKAEDFLKEYKKEIFQMVLLHFTLSKLQPSQQFSNLFQKVTVSFIYMVIFLADVVEQKQ